jgi:hypothetical protein
MKIAITWDYELFFGELSGSVSNCMLEPTDQLLSLAAKYSIPFTFFPDVGCLVKFDEEPSFNDELQKIKAQIINWDSKGHETGLHIHPHWEKSIWNGNVWEHDLSYYKLADFSIHEAQSIVKKYATYISSLLQQPVKSYRAGGWCAQPFEPISQVMQNIGIQFDTSVFKGGKNTTTPYHYDFISAPKVPFWKFSSDVLTPDSNGVFTEIPISSMEYSPFFFWKLFILGRLLPRKHKPIGNGFPAKGGGSKKDLLTRSHHLCVSADGYFATQLNNALKKSQQMDEPFLVIIGHPKALTEFGLKTLEKFISKQHLSHEFVTISSIL